MLSGSVISDNTFWRGIRSCPDPHNIEAIDLIKNNQIPLPFVAGSRFLAMNIGFFS